MHDSNFSFVECGVCARARVFVCVCIKLLKKSIMRLLFKDFPKQTVSAYERFFGTLKRIKLMILAYQLVGSRRQEALMSSHFQEDKLLRHYPAACSRDCTNIARRESYWSAASSRFGRSLGFPGTDSDLAGDDMRTAKPQTRFTASCIYHCSV